MSPFLLSNNLFSTAQHGFLAGKSCVTQMLEFVEYISEANDNGEDVDIVYLDFCKAFDKVPHEKLLHKLYHYGITGQVINWVKDILANLFPNLYQ